MSKLILLIIVLFSTFRELNAQSISIDSLYYINTDTVIRNEANRYYVANLWMAYNGSAKRLLCKTVVNTIPVFSWASPQIIKFAFNESDSCVYQVDFHNCRLGVDVIYLDGLFRNPYSCGTPDFYNWNKQHFLSVNAEIADYTTECYLRLKDIDMSIQNNIMTLRCYKPWKELVVFQYDFSKKEWSIPEDRKLTDEEVGSLECYND